MTLRGDLADYKFTGETANGLWGKYISWQVSQDLSAAWTRHWQLQRNPSSKAAFEVKRASPPLPSFQMPQPTYATQRHSSAEISEAIEQIIARLDVSDRHRQDLHRRGFNDRQIEAYGYRSVDRYQKLPSPLQAMVAGIQQERFTNPESGIFIPVRSPKGYWIGWQIRLDNREKDKYRWAYTKEPELTSRLLETQEFPLAYCRPDGGIVNKSSIGLTESVGFKPQLAANFTGGICLGSASGLFASNPRTFKHYLASARQELGGTQLVTIYPDAGAVENDLVLRQYRRAEEMLLDLGYQVQFAWWEQVKKQKSPDIDQNPASIQLISADEFWKLGLQHSGWHPYLQESYERKIERLTEKFAAALQDSATQSDLKDTISKWENKHYQVFDLVKQSAWERLSRSEKLTIRSMLEDMSASQQLYHNYHRRLSSRFPELTGSKADLNVAYLMAINAESQDSIVKALRYGSTYRDTLQKSGKKQAIAATVAIADAARQQINKVTHPPDADYGYSAGFPRSLLSIPAPRHLSRS